MDYEKLHKDTINKLQQMVSCGKITVETACGICADFVPESEDERIRKDIIVLVKDWWDRVNKNNISTKEQMLAWLEKHKIKEHDVCDFCEGRYGCVNPCPTKLIEEEKPTDKVEPKFKTGDWISGYYTNYKVLSVNNDGYVVEDVDGNKINILFENEKFHQLWTIQDAKDGDVLVASDNSIFLFKGTIDCACKHYVALTTDGAVKFNEGLEHYWETSRAVHPATKEQRVQLEKAMTDAGYTFDFKNKELKKIEQKPAWSEEDYIEIKRITGLLEGWASTFEKTFYEKECKRGVAWLKNLKDRVLPQSKQKWNGTKIAPPIDSDVCG